jgi:DNA-binding NtrC family response regulator
MTRILVVDDEAHLRLSIVTLLKARGHEVTAAASGEEALRNRDHKLDAVVLDVVLPGMSGIDTLVQLRQLDPQLPCIVITAHASVRDAVEAMKIGAYDYIAKPFDNDDLILTVERALDHRRLTTRVRELEEDLSARAEFNAIVGRSEPIQQVLRRLAKVATSDATVLLSGETGTGKELAARSLHRGSNRASGPFVALNCATIPSSLAEAELFGHVRGAFTDAREPKSGRFEQADKGTLFLDEVGELPLDIQSKLLRAIQEREVLRLGAEQPIRLDVRLVAATNRELSDEVAAGRFRQDLYYRLNVVNIRMPAIREHVDDLPLLTCHLLELINAECRTKVAGVAAAVTHCFQRYSWPGNVRELANVLRHAVIMAEQTVLQLHDLPEYLLTVKAETAPVGDHGQTLEAVLATTERRLLEATLEKFRGNRSAAALALGIDRRTLYTKLKQYEGNVVPSDRTDRI